MELPNLLEKLKAKPEEPELFLAVEISTQEVKTAVWQVLGKHATIVAVGSIQEWSDEKDDAALIEAVDASLSESMAGQDPDLDRVVLSLPEMWISGDKIAKPRKQTLKNLCDKLDLKPMGFVVATEAVVNYLKDEEGTPISSILVRVATDELLVSMVRLGVIEGTQVVGRSDDINADVQEGIARFPANGNLPSRIILYDGQSELEEIRQSLIDYDWQDALPFLHFPKIETLQPDTSIKAAALAGGSEIAASLLAMQKQQKKAEGDVRSEQVTEVVEEVEREEDEPPDLSEEFGFTAVDSEPKTELRSEELKEVESKVEEESELPEIAEPELKGGDEKPRSVLMQRLVPVISGLKKVGSMPLLLIRKIRLPRLPRPRLPGSGTSGVLLAILGSFVLILVASGLAFWHLPKAEATIYLGLQPLEREVEFVLDPDLTELEPDSLSIPTESRVIRLSGSDQVPTTGSVTVGQRARGTVTIFNRTNSSKVFEAGTTIAYNQLQFTLNEEVRIASASSRENPDFSVTIQPSSAEVGVTAAAIGSDYNIPKDTQMSVDNFASDSFVARATGAFTGGSSRQVPAVSQSDRDTLRTRLSTSLKEDIEEELGGLRGDNRDVIIISEPEVVESGFSHDVGDQAESLSLSQDIAQTVYIYDLTHVTLLAQQASVENIPESMMLKPDETKVEVLGSDVSGEEVSITSRVILMLFPRVDQTAIAGGLKGKSPSQAEAVMRTIPNYQSYEAEFTPRLPGPLLTFPHKPGNTTVKLVPVTQRD